VVDIDLTCLLSFMRGRCLLFAMSFIRKFTRKMNDKKKKDREEEEEKVERERCESEREFNERVRKKKEVVEDGNSDDEFESHELMNVSLTLLFLPFILFIMFSFHVAQIKAQMINDLQAQKARIFGSLHV
jgi:hypothetical protein